MSILGLSLSLNGINIMTSKSNVKLTISVPDGGRESPVYSDSESIRGFHEYTSDSESPPNSPYKEERKPLRVEFLEMDTDVEKNPRKIDIENDLNKLSKKGSGSIRYTQPRMSLLGKPLNYRLHRKDARVRKLQARIYNFLERPKNMFSVFYHLLM